MMSCGYKVLEYAESELIVSGVPFAIVLHLQDHPGGCVRGYVVSDWEAKVSDDVPFVRAFLEDVERYSRAEDSIALSFFDRLEGLSSGAIRLAKSGWSAVRDHSLLSLDGDPAVKMVPAHGFAGLVQGLEADAFT